MSRVQEKSSKSQRFRFQLFSLLFWLSAHSSMKVTKEGHGEATPHSRPTHLRRALLATHPRRWVGPHHNRLERERGRERAKSKEGGDRRESLLFFFLHFFHSLPSFVSNFVPNNVGAHRHRGVRCFGSNAGSTRHKRRRCAQAATRVMHLRGPVAVLPSRGSIFTTQPPHATMPSPSPSPSAATASASTSRRRRRRHLGRRRGGRGEPNPTGVGRRRRVVHHADSTTSSVVVVVVIVGSSSSAVRAGQRRPVCSGGGGGDDG